MSNLKGLTCRLFDETQAAVCFVSMTVGVGDNGSCLKDARLSTLISRRKMIA